MLRGLVGCLGVSVGLFIDKSSVLGGKIVGSSGVGAGFVNLLEENGLGALAINGFELEIPLRVALGGFGSLGRVVTVAVSGNMRFKKRNYLGESSI